MEVTRETHGDAALLVIAGQIDMYSSPELRGELTAALESGAKRLVLDMEKVEFIDSSGLATLIEVLQKLRGSEGELRLSSLNSSVLGVFELSNLDQLFDIRATREEALQDDPA